MKPIRRPPCSSSTQQLRFVRCCVPLSVSVSRQVRSVREFLASYPAWAKLLALSGLITIATLVFAPGQKDAPGAAPTGDVELRITGVTLFPHDPDAEVQVFARGHLVLEPAG